MKLKNSYFYTIREDIKDEESNSGKLLVRSGMIKKSSNGIYMYMPLGLKVLNNIEKIIREEMDKSGAQELLMPSLLPAEVYEKSGRRDNFGKDMFQLRDRYEREMCLGPTHEEMFVNAASQKIKSYKDMPFNLYQIASKYRDEPRPRYGLIRVREFKMKDAYTFDKDYEGLEKSYKIMYDTYKKIFDRIGLDYKIVTADTGVMGGLLSEEFQAITPIGEDTLVICDNCDYASNIEVSACVEKDIKQEVYKEIELQETPNAGKIEDVAKFLNEDPSKFVKTLIYNVDSKLYACLLPGDRDLNETKVRKLLNGKEIALASFEDVEKVTNAKVGFAGPIGLQIPIIVDTDVLKMTNFIVGANKTDYHYKNVNIKDFKYEISGDIKNVKENDPCPKCGKPLRFTKGIEVGNTFKLGDKYSKSLGLTYLDQENKEQLVIMGCYGIGLGRILASIVEQNNDENGIIWPMNVAPYKVGIVIINNNDEKQVQVANSIYRLLQDQNIEVLLDDRDERPGVKFNDMDLIGLPIKITVGKKVVDDKVELKLRNQGYSEDVLVEDIISKVKELVK